MYYYIVNPAAGHSALRSIQDKLRTELKSLGIGGEFVTTTGPGDATQLAVQAAAKGYTTIVAVGGDDTVNEVINGLSDDKAAVGIVPIGNTNRVAHQLGIQTWQQACTVLAARRIADYGLIAAGKQFFLSTLSLGFEAEPAAPAPETKTGFGAKVQQARGRFQRAKEYQPITCHLRVDDQFSVDAEVFSLQVTNQKFQNPTAPNMLAVSLMAKPNSQALRKLLWRPSAHVVAENPTTHFMGHQVVIESSLPITALIDGTPVGQTPLTIRLTDRRVRFIVEKPEPSI